MNHMHAFFGNIWTVHINDSYFRIVSSQRAGAAVGGVFEINNYIRVAHHFVRESHTVLARNFGKRGFLARVGRCCNPYRKLAAVLNEENTFSNKTSDVFSNDLEKGHALSVIIS